ncbi:MAG: AmmeMemoRadiSam system protein B [Deltaproteobacteria bacterium]|nr:AmmeMemoRadiSam system protein B [Deltaproteobacteria bacterium]
MPQAIREPAVAGRFYPGEAAALSRDVAALMGPAPEDPQPAIALVGPHAGYMYSGSILGRTYARVQVPPKVIVMCPNHTGRGVTRSLWPSGGWRLPTGVVPVDDALVEGLRAHCGAQPDVDAHLHEHAAEVHLPFAQARQPALQIAVLCLGHLGVHACRAIGEGLAQVVATCREPVLLVASTDMSHFISAPQAAVRDRMALERIEALDPVGLHHTVSTHQISMCGVIPTTVALFAANVLGARHATVIDYGHSGQTSGDHARVVGYAGVVVG